VIADAARREEERMRPLAAVGVVLCLLGWLGVACQAPSPTLTSAPPPTTTLIPAHTQSPTSTPGPLTDTEAIALVKEEVAARGVAPHALRITIGGEPRSASIRYSSSYAVDSNVFQSQTVLIALAAAQAIARVQPPINGGMRLAVMPGGESEVGLRVIVIDWSSLEAWANGSISDQEFVSQWTVGAITRE
jgi:hypothetical protein